MEIHALRNANNPVFIGGKGGPVNGAARRAVFGELSNFNVTHKPVQTKKVQPVLPVKPIAVVQPKRAQVQHEIPQPAPALPPAQADVSMKEEELCQAFSNTLFPVEDIDEGDADMPQLCPEYVKDIYAYLRSLESQQSVRPLYMRGYDINARMRALLVDWLIQVHSRFQLLQETLYMTVAILDRFLQVRVAQKLLQKDAEKHTLAKYFLELTLLDYDMVHFNPSETAAAALFLSQLVLDGQKWSPTQQHYSTYDEAHLKPIMQHIAKNVVMVNEGLTKHVTVRKKYSSSRLMKISLLPQLKSSFVKDLAAPLLSRS
ncbi:G2/mitotic-specific cyclin-B2-like [Sinocyclocheilus grahami]|uniref:G2/mitotic-specific cyclin-B2-like n=1 Tax=Sinocyclocheilus grahami TaxID=75366 RepID=UPI0007AD49C1|nr:PREDICTED: G2/mitotic-specific cyclin-B2-like [Sinocyclocheilus grahami]